MSWCQKCDASLDSAQHQEHLAKKRQWYASRKKKGHCQDCEQPLAPKSKQFCVDHLKRRNSRTKAYRDARKGRCIITSCPAHLSAGSIQYCDEHLRHNQLLSHNRRAAKISKGLCIVGRCGNQPMKDGLVCDNHNDTQARKDRTRKENRLSKGLCQGCGEEPVASEKLGYNCLLKSVARSNLPSSSFSEGLSIKLKAQQNQCNACGTAITIGQNAALGHLEAVSRSGMSREELRKTTSLDDVQWLCEECNTWQSKFSWAEFLQILPVVYDLNIAKCNLQLDNFAKHAIKICHHLGLRKPPSPLP